MGILGTAVALLGLALIVGGFIVTRGALIYVTLEAFRELWRDSNR